MPGWDFFYRHFLCCVVFCCDVTRLHVHALHEKHLVTQLCFLFRTVYAPFGSLQMCQHRTGNNTASETTQSFEEKVLQGFHNSKGLNTKTTAGPFCLVWYGLISLILPLFHLPVCHFQPNMSSVMRGLDVSLHLTCHPYPSSDDVRTFPFYGLYCVYVTRFW